MAIGAVGQNDLAGGVSLYDLVGTSWNAKTSFSVVGSTEEQIGDFVALSADGSRVVIRRYGATVSPVEVYDADTGVKLGPSLNDCNAKGKPVSISADGNRVAVSCEHWIAPNHQKKAGRVHIYDWRAASNQFLLQATLVGDVINADVTNTNEFFGWASSFSADGNRLAVTTIFHGVDGGTKKAGQVQVFRFDASSTEWGLLGNAMLGEHKDGRFGMSIDLAANGNTIVIGAPTTDSNDTDLQNSNKAETDNANGEVHVFVLDDTNNQWALKGQIVQGESAGDQFGRSVAISDDGTRFAAGAGYHNANRGQVRLFDFEGATWNQAHGDIEGLAVNDEFGRGVMSVALSGNGYRIASGSQGANNQDGASTGRARVFDLHNDDAPSTAPSNRPSQFIASAAPTQSLTPSSVPAQITSVPSAPPSISIDFGASLAPSDTEIQTTELGKFDWDLPQPFNVSVTFTGDSGGEEIKLSYNISRRTAIISIYEKDCQTLVGDDVVAVSQQTKNTSPKHGQLDVTLDVNQLNVVSSTIWSNGTSTGEGFIDLCVRVDLVLDDTNQTSVNFHEQKLMLTIELSQGFQVADIVLDREDADTEQQNAQVNFELTSCQCNATADCLVNETLYQGDDVYICVFADPGSDIEIAAVEEFDFVQGDLRILAIDNSTEDLLTAVLSVGKTVIIRSQMRSDFFVQATLGPVLAEGKVSLIFGGAVARSLRLDSILSSSGQGSRMTQVAQPENHPFQSILSLADSTTISVSNGESTEGSNRSAAPLIGGIIGGACAFGALLVAFALRKKRGDDEEAGSDPYEGDFA